MNPWLTENDRLAYVMFISMTVIVTKIKLNICHHVQCEFIFLTVCVQRDVCRP